MIFTIDYASPDNIDAQAIEFNEKGFNNPIKALSSEEAGNRDKLERWCGDALETIAALHMSNQMADATCFSRDKKTRKDDILTVFENEEAVKQMIQGLRSYRREIDDRRFHGFDELTLLHDEPWIANGYGLKDGEPWSVECMAQALERGMGYIEPPAQHQAGYFTTLKSVYRHIGLVTEEFLEKPLEGFSDNPESFEDIMGWVSQCIDIMSAWHTRGWYGAEEDEEIQGKLIFNSLDDFKFFASSVKKFPNFFPTPCWAFLENTIQIDSFLDEDDEVYSNKGVGEAMMKAIEDLED